jgi:hypothetical protein
VAHRKAATRAENPRQESHIKEGIETNFVLHTKAVCDFIIILLLLVFFFFLYTTKEYCCAHCDLELSGPVKDDGKGKRYHPDCYSQLNKQSHGPCGACNKPIDVKPVDALGTPKGGKNKYSHPS